MNLPTVKNPRIKKKKNRVKLERNLGEIGVGF